jgi:16S rRNA processing protein RimM
MEHEGYYYLGTIIRAHGIKGDIIIKLDVDHPESYKKLKEVFLEREGLLQSFKCSRISLNNEFMHMHLDGIESMNEAEELIRSEVFLPYKNLPKLSGKRIYFHEAVGMKVIDETEGELGPIQKIYDLPQQPVASVLFQGKELMFPMIPEFIQKIDRDNGILYVNLPAGLTDIYR